MYKFLRLLLLVFYLMISNISFGEETYVLEDVTPVESTFESDSTSEPEITITKDGVTVAESISLIDPVENLAITMMKDAARRTANSAGDGTTTAIVLTEALVKAGEKFLKPEHNITEVVKNIKKTTEDVIDKLKKDSRKVTPSMLKDVATISSNNDSSGKLSESCLCGG